MSIKAQENKGINGIITLVTDFGLSDPYAGIMKGVILSINPRARIVDITHQVPSYDIFAASRIIESSYSFFPLGTIHVLIIDPGVGGRRKIACVSACGHIFVAPDNGVLSRVIENAGEVSGVWVENPSWFLHPVSKTFHGRDIFAPVAARLSMGLDMADLGPVLDPGAMVFLPEDLPEIKASGTISGRVVRVDAFGNLVTNISRQAFRKAFGKDSEKTVVVRIPGHEIYGISDTYDAAPPGALLALFGSGGFLELAVNRGNASDLYHVGIDAPVILDRVKGGQVETKA